MGVGIIGSGNDNLTLVDANVLKVARGTPLAERLQTLYTELRSYISHYEPDEVAIEEPFVARNVRSAMAVGQAQAVAMIAAAASDISVTSYSPREVKLAVTGFGDSSKEQVQEMVILSLNPPTKPMSLDSSDALAVALCHINSKRVESLISRQRN